MKITEEAPGLFAAVLDMPVTPADLAELAAQLPAEAHLTDVEQDGDSVYTTWEVHRVAPIN